MTLPNIDTAQSDSSYRDVPNVSCGFARSGDALERHFPDLVVSKQKLRRADAIACVRLKRQEAKRNLKFASRPFVLCGLPGKQPHAGQFLHERRNGHFQLQVTGHPSYGLPWGSGSARSHLSGDPRHSATESRESVSQRGGDARYVRHATGRGMQYGRLIAASRQLKAEHVSELRSRRVSQRFRLDVRDSTRD